MARHLTIWNILYLTEAKGIFKYPRVSLIFQHVLRERMLMIYQKVLISDAWVQSYLKILAFTVNKNGHTV